MKIVLNRVSLSDDQLAALLSVVQQGQASSGMTRALIGERCLVIDTFQAPAKERQAAVTNSVYLLLEDGDRSATEQSSWDGDFAFFLQAVEESIAASKLPFPKSLEAQPKLRLRSIEAKQKKYLVSRLVLDHFHLLLSNEAQRVARLRCAEVALALQRYRLAHQNTLPASLDELVPGFLKVVPTNPYSGAPVQYRLESATRCTVSCSTDDPKADDVAFQLLR